LAPLQCFLPNLSVEHNFLKSFAQPRYHCKGGGEKKELWESPSEPTPHHPPASGASSNQETLVGKETESSWLHPTGSHDIQFILESS
jgi:hypothetical protein